MSRRSNRLFRRAVTVLWRRAGWVAIAALFLFRDEAWRDYWQESAMVLGLAALHFLFAAPAYCGAETREALSCRNNASGLLRGCYLREHKWQKLKMSFHVRAWKRLLRRLWGQNPIQTAGMLTALAGCVAAMAAVVSAWAAVQLLGM